MKEPMTDDCYGGSPLPSALTFKIHQELTRKRNRKQRTRNVVPKCGQKLTVKNCFGKIKKRVDTDESRWYYKQARFKRAAENFLEFKKKV